MTETTKTVVPKSTKTTIAGIIAFLALVFTGIQPLFDGDPETHIDGEQISLIVAAFAALAGGYIARDNNVSSGGETIE